MINACGAADIALRRYDGKRKVGRALENVIYLELLRRGYEVKTGKIAIRSGTKSIEVDFVAQKPGGIIEYYQVAWTVLSDDNDIIGNLFPSRWNIGIVG